jgi:hypothetical protein
MVVRYLSIDIINVRGLLRRLLLLEYSSFRMLLGGW